MCQNFFPLYDRVIFHWIYYYIAHLMYHLHVSVDGHLSCLHLWAIVNNVAMNLAAQMSVWVPAFSPLAGKYSEVQLLILCPSLFDYHLTPSPPRHLSNTNHLLPNWIILNQLKDWAEEDLQKRKVNGLWAEQKSVTDSHHPWTWSVECLVPIVEVFADKAQVL